ncbi:hypothetical protein LWI28_002987 [Acer negundo]|uniref:AMP-activated protein kinase glycogen-binding domain-containing protein n=1 Tax=Acer negundo TaxID=4023 RepID=A0AAD5IL56_ACENE|nr:hypothetical protein LWI28_002987 [Acer negundo]KAK4842330.1 hypothetical protein QYF36_019739 [Acer negundo]
MVSFTSASCHFLASPYSLADLNARTFPSWFLVFNPRRVARKQEQLVSLNPAGRGRSLLGFLEAKKRNCGGCCSWLSGGFARRCKKDCYSEGDLGLEAEILEFMRNSENPDVFPSKKQLMDAGRMDLVEAIVRQGGWLAFGWDLDDEDVEEEEQKWDLDLIMDKEYKNGALQERVESGRKGVALEANEVRGYGASSGSASSSGRSLEAATANDSGIEGILSRLEKERNINFGFALRDKGNTTQLQRDHEKDDWLAGTSKDVTVADIGRSSRSASLNPGRGEINNSGSKLTHDTSLTSLDGLGNSLKPEMWRTWSIQRAGFSDMEFEAAEIAPNEKRTMDGSCDEILDLREGSSENLNEKEELNFFHEEINHNQVRNRLQHLELELSSVLQTLRSNKHKVVSQTGYESSSNDLLKLSDALEFQENEIMNAQDRLRSIRAKLVVLEGKMALTIIDAQKMVEEKQKRIDEACRALRLIRTACIVWPNSASQVLLAGSFDGWVSQRKMEKSSTGIFSLCLKLYPGRYEIKFIVDGEWKIDPLRPIVHNNGYENNLLIIK